MCSKKWEHTSQRPWGQLHIMFSIFTIFIVVIYQLRLSASLAGYTKTSFQSMYPAEGERSNLLSSPHPSLSEYHLEKLPLSIEKYIHWHSKMHACLENRTCSSAAPKILLWGCPGNLIYQCAGIGDRLRGIQFAVLLAIITHRLFLLDWPDKPFPFRNAVTPSVINWTVPHSVSYYGWGMLKHTTWPKLEWEICPSQWNCTGGSKNVQPKNNELPKTMNMDRGSVKSMLDRFENLTIFAPATMHSVSQLLENRDMMAGFSEIRPHALHKVTVHKLLLKILFQPSSIVLKRLSSILKPIGFTKPYIAVHARTGMDFGEHINRRFARLPNSTILATRLLDCVDDVLPVDHPRHVLLASDSISLKSYFVAVAQDRNFTIATENIPATHVGRKWGAPRTIPKKKLFSSFVNAFAEFYAVAKAQKIIGNRSGFSRMAFFSGNASEYVLVETDPLKTSKICIRSAETKDL